MKLIVAVVRPERLEAVKEALAEVEVFRLTVADVQAVLPNADLAPRVRLEIAVNEAFVEPTVRAIVAAARTDEPGPGDGGVFILPLADVVRVRTGERGAEAV